MTEPPSRPTPKGEIEGDQVQAHTQGEIEGDQVQAHTQGEIEGDQIQAHTQGGNWGGLDPGSPLPPPEKQTAAYGQWAAGTHPTGMHSCFIFVLRGWLLKTSPG